MVSTETIAKDSNKLFTPAYLFLCLTYLFFLSAASMLVVVLPLYVQHVGGSISEIGIVIGSLGLTIIPVELWAGRLADIRGRKPILIAAGLILVVSIFSFNFATSLPLLIVAQLFRGVGMGFFFPTTMALTADIAPARRRGEAMAYVTALYSVAQAVAPPLGVVLVNSFGFTSVFASATGLALIALALTITIPEKKREQRIMPATGVTLINRQIIFPCLVWSSFTLSLGAILAFVPVFVVERELGNPGLFFTVNAISVVVTRALTGKLSDRYGRSAAVIPGMALASIALIILPLSNSMAILLISSAIYAAGLALTQPALAALAIDKVRTEERGAAMGTFSAAFDVGFTVGAMSYGRVLETAGFVAVYFSSAAVSFIGLVAYIVWIAKSRSKRRALRTTE